MTGVRTGDRQLNAGHSHVEVSWERVAVDLGNPGLVDTVAQTAAGVLGPYLFDVIKPGTLHRINHYLAQHGAITLRLAARRGRGDAAGSEVGVKDRRCITNGIADLG